MSKNIFENFGLKEKECAEIPFSEKMGCFLLFLMMSNKKSDYYMPITKSWYKSMTKAIKKIIKAAKIDKDYSCMPSLAMFRSCFQKNLFSSSCFFLPKKYVNNASKIQQAFSFSGLKSQLIEMEKIIRQQ